MLFFLTAMGLVFVAELGDKTQLVAMAFAAKYSAVKVLIGILGAVSLLNIIAVALGSYITYFVPIGAIRVAASIIFVMFGVFNLKEGSEEEEEKSFKLGPIMTVALTFFIGELGDKTQLMTITLAAQYDMPYAIFLGSTAGMLLADGLGIIIGSTVFRKIPDKAVRLISSCIFLFFGSMGLYNNVPHKYITPLSVILYTVIILSMAAAVYLNDKRKKSNSRGDSEV